MGRSSEDENDPATDLVGGQNVKIVIVGDEWARHGSVWADTLGK